MSRQNCLSKFLYTYLIFLGHKSKFQLKIFRENNALLFKQQHYRGGNVVKLHAAIQWIIPRTLSLLITYPFLMLAPNLNMQMRKAS